MTLRVIPEGLAAAGAAVEALTSQLAAAQASALPFVSAVMAPAADPVSLQAALSLSAHGIQQTGVTAQGVAELGRAGFGVAESATSYTVGDTQAASSYAGQSAS